MFCFSEIVLFQFYLRYNHRLRARTGNSRVVAVLNRSLSSASSHYTASTETRSVRNTTHLVRQLIHALMCATQSHVIYGNPV